MLCVEARLHIQRLRDQSFGGFDLADAYWRTLYYITYYIRLKCILLLCYNSIVYDKVYTM